MKQNGIMTREAAEEYSASMAQIGEGWWRQIAWAQQQGIPKAMGLSLPAWREKYYGHVKVSLEARREAVAELAETGLSNVKIADVLGVAEGTVRNDKRPSQDYEEIPPQDTENSQNSEAPPRTIEIRTMDFRELLGGLTNVDAIITDPPYDRTAIPLYGELARLAKGCLKPEGILAVMCGQSYLPEILPVMAAIIPYRWTMAYLAFGPHTKLWQKNILCGWKPIVLFGAVGKSIFDVVTSEGADKRYHEWGQSESGTAMLVDALTEPGQLVVDPFAGGGTTGVVCERLGRNFIGGDVHATRA